MRNRLAAEVGKGIESLRMEQVTLTDTLGYSVAYYYAVGPFDVDVDVVDMVLTVGTAPSGVVNLVNVFNGPSSLGKQMMLQINLNVLTPQVPARMRLVRQNLRVRAGTPIVVVGTFLADHAESPATATLVIKYEIPIYDHRAITTTYGGYG